jgi:polar amino acid transport system substrate-binding protein
MLLVLSALMTASLAACGGGGSSKAATASNTSSECKALQQKYPKVKGATLTDAMNPNSPGYEAVDPNNPSKYVGFDIDLVEALGNCLGFKVAYKSIAFAALLPTLQSGQSDLVLSDLYVTPVRAKVVDFITYAKVFNGVLVRKGNPKHIDGVNTSLCGVTAAEITGYVQVPLIQGLAPDCQKAGKPAPSVQLYDNDAIALQAILTGRADTYFGDLNTVDQPVRMYPTQLEKAAEVTLPYSISIALPKNRPELRTALFEALQQLQNVGLEKTLLEKWSLGAATQETPRVVTG